MGSVQSKEDKIKFEQFFNLFFKVVCAIAFNPESTFKITIRNSEVSLNLKILIEKFPGCLKFVNNWGEILLTNQPYCLCYSNGKTKIYCTFWERYVDKVNEFYNGER